MGAGVHHAHRVPGAPRPPRLSLSLYLIIYIYIIYNYNGRRCTSRPSGPWCSSPSSSPSSCSCTSRQLPARTHPPISPHARTHPSPRTHARTYFPAHTHLPISPHASIHPSTDLSLLCFFPFFHLYLFRLIDHRSIDP